MEENSKKKGFRIQPRILIMFLVLGIVPPVVGHLILVSGARQIYQEILGTFFSERADDLLRELSGQIEGAAVQVANLARAEQVRELARRASQRRPESQDFQERIRRVEEGWPDLDVENSAMLREILENPTSRFLRDYNSVAAAFREILVTDAYGRLVAATNKTSDYFQADEKWWQRAFLEGRGSRFISDIQFDDSADVYGMEIAEPIRDLSTQAVVGIVKAIYDSHALFSLLESTQLAHQTQVFLLRPDGSVVWGPEAQERYELAEQFTAVLHSPRNFEEITRGQEHIFLALPSGGLKEKLPELDWYVVLQAPSEAVFAPFANLNRWFLYIVVFAVVVVIGLAVLFSWMLSKPAVETDPHFERLPS